MASSRMHYFMDLRYTIPPLINIIMLLHDHGKPWYQDDASETGHGTTLKMPILLLAIAILIFLFTSIKLPLSVSMATHLIRLRAGDFSGAVAISLLASFIFSPPLFWIAYLLIICISPWYSFILNLFKHFYHTLQSIPTFIIICVTQQHESPEPEPLQVETDILYVEGQPMQYQSSSERDFVIAIDGEVQE